MPPLPGRAAALTLAALLGGCATAGAPPLQLARLDAPSPPPVPAELLSPTNGKADAPLQLDLVLAIAAQERRAEAEAVALARQAQPVREAAAAPAVALAAVAAPSQSVRTAARPVRLAQAATRPPARADRVDAARRNVAVSRAPLPGRTAAGPSVLKATLVRPTPPVTAPAPARPARADLHRASLAQRVRSLLQAWLPILRV